MKKAGSIRKILVANRGEIAVRIMRTCRQLGIETVAVYTGCDKNSYHVFLADQAVCIGDLDHPENYMGANNIISAALITGCDAIHPGYGFLSEDAGFARVVREQGLIFIGPSDAVLSRIENKHDIKEDVAKLGIPVIRGWDEADFDDISPRDFPILLKPKFGGGGKGIKLIRDRDELALEREKMLAGKMATHNTELYAEQYLPGTKHIEIQLISDGDRITALPERDCSYQIRHQKLIEESPSVLSATDPSVVEKLSDAAVRIFRHFHYDNVGTVEFLVGPQGEFFFLEINARLQVEHGVSEEITDLDLAEMQIRLADGEPNRLPSKIHTRGYAMEVRINATDPEKGFLPECGRLDLVSFPGGPGVRIDTDVYQGYELLPYYDSLLAKVIVRGNERSRVIRRMVDALDEMIIAGVKTNQEFLCQILSRGDFGAGKHTTSDLGDLYE